MSGLRQSIREIQQRLNQAGYRLKVDGTFGPLTANAIVQFMEGKLDQIEPPRTEHFHMEEWRCRDGLLPPKAMWPQLQKLMNKLEELRTALGDKPIRILSGYRSLEYNAKLYAKSQKSGGGGVAKNSAHMRCTAADIRVTGKTIQEVYDAADKVFMNGGVGIYKSSGFVHVDVDYLNKRPARWGH